MSQPTTARVATAELVRQLVREVHEQIVDRRHPEPLVVGARARPVWDDGTLLDDSSGRIEVAAVSSPLAARRAILDFGADPDNAAATLVLLTDLPESALGNDVLARLVRPRLIGLSEWDAVRRRFGVARLDPAFNDGEYSWMSSVLLELPAASIPAGIGVLSTEIALRAVTEHLLGGDGTSVEQLLVATATSGFADRVAATEPTRITQLCATLADRHGHVGELIAGCIQRGSGERALPAGLAARTLAGAIAGTYAQAKVADLTGVPTVTDAALLAWANAAELAFASLAATGDAVVGDLNHIGSSLVTEWQAPNPGASDILSASFEARLGALGDTLDRALDDPAVTMSGELRHNTAAVTRHRDATTELGRPRAQRALLAARLATWLQDPVSAQHGTGLVAAHGSTPLVFPDAARAYERDGAWVDRARRRVGEGDNSPEPFAAALRRVAEAAHGRRSDGNHGFAVALARFTGDGTDTELADTDVICVEDVLERVVVPLAKKNPTLLVVLDGCSLPAFLELADQFRTIGLQEIAPHDRRLVGLAALPTVTAVSRTSLLSGRLLVGGAADETRELPAHPKVAKLDGAPAVLFHHRPDLLTGVGQALPATVTAALGPSGPRLVAAVVNTIDDELSKGDFTPEYRIEHLGPLAGLLRAAVDADRTVVVTSDHGHVLGVGLDGKGKVDKGGDGGDRWRVADRDPSEDEVLLRGERVLMGGDAGVLAPWHDDLRYSSKHGGYHGGATPDECLVPIAVFTPTGAERTPTGWDQIQSVEPAWWDLYAAASNEPAPTDAAAAAAAVAGRKGASAGRSRGARAEIDGQGGLFGDGTGNDPVDAGPDSGGDSGSGGVSGSGNVGGSGAGAGTSVPAAVAEPEWMEALLISDVYKVQLGAVTRGRPTEERVRATLSVLAGRGGVASFAVIAQGTGLSPSRVQGLLPNLARVLNVDGYGVLDIDQPAQEVRLNVQVLRDQFLGGAP